MPYLYSYGGRAGGGDVTINTTVQEVTASGLSEDAGQVLTEGMDGGALLLPDGIRAALDATLGGTGWRAGASERVLSYDAATREIGILDGTGVVLPLATGEDAGLMSAADKQALAAAGGTAPSPGLTRADIAAGSFDAGITVLRTVGHAVPGDGGGAVWLRVPSEPVHAGKVQSADGAWWALDAGAGRVSVLQFGAARTTDGTTPLTDAAPAFAAALAFATLWTEGTAARGMTVSVPPGRYLIGATLELRAGIRLIGQPGGGGATVRGPVLEFPDTAGIVIHGARSAGAGTGVESPDDAATFSAAGAAIEGLTLRGPQAGVGFDAARPGLRVRAAAVLRDLAVDGFSGDGVRIEAGEAGATDATGWSIHGLSATANGGSGLFVGGTAAGGGHASGLWLADNGRWGLEDRSDGANAYAGVTLRRNGGAASGQGGETAIVARSGAWYMAEADADVAALVGTDPASGAPWRLAYPAGSAGVDAALAPDWQVGQPAGTYVSGGAALVTGATNRATLTGVDVAPDQGLLTLDPAAAAFGGRTGTVAPGPLGAGTQVAERVVLPVAPRLAEAGGERDLRALRVIEVPGDATLAPGDAFALLRMTSAAASTVTVPAGALSVGESVSVVQSGTGTTTVAAGAGVTVSSEAGLSLRGQHAVASLICIGADAYVLVGALA